MDEEKNTQEVTDNPAGEQPETTEKTFTQDELNRIIQERLAKEKTKLDAELAAQKNQLRMKEMLLERHLPSRFAEIVDCSSEEKLEEYMSVIDEIMKETKDTKPILQGLKPGESNVTPWSSFDHLTRQAMGLTD